MRFLPGRVIDRLALPITRNCNRTCPECPARTRKKSPTHVPVAELKRVGKLVGRIGKVEVTGGEPTLHPEFQRISEFMHIWFDCKDIMLLTNAVELASHPEKLPLLLNYDWVYATDYTPMFVKRHGGVTNSAAVDKVSEYLARQSKTKFWRQIMDSHNPISAPPYKGDPSNCPYYHGDMVAYLGGDIYGCCTSWQLPVRGKRIPLTEAWRAHLTEIDIPCEECFLTGK
jgi:hypothetical protein